MFNLKTWSSIVDYYRFYYFLRHKYAGQEVFVIKPRNSLGRRKDKTTFISHPRLKPTTPLYCPWIKQGQNHTIGSMAKDRALISRETANTLYLLYIYLTYSSYPVFSNSNIKLPLTWNWDDIILDTKTSTPPLQTIF